jgi:tRNA A37 threonylcarbamoyladenosine synthetase subunit TsaC/SUA5/YrdC
VLAVTSANLSGLPPATTAGEVLEQLSGWIDVVVDGGVCAGGIASTIVRAFAGEAEILREGAISADRIQASIRSC